MHPVKQSGFPLLDLVAAWLLVGIAGNVLRRQRYRSAPHRYEKRRNLEKSKGGLCSRAGTHARDGWEKERQKEGREEARRKDTVGFKVHLIRALKKWKEVARMRNLP